MTESSPPPSPRPFSTHAVRFDDGVAIKTFQSQLDHVRRFDGHEARREWQALNLLARYAPGLAPEPIRADPDADPPVIMMSRVPGEPLGTRPATVAQVDAIAAAFHRLHYAIPVTVLDTLEPAPGGPRFLRDRTRSLAASCQADSLDPVPRQAYRAALAWLDSGCDARTEPGTGRVIFAQCDPNLANRLWDGHDVRLVDFEQAGRRDLAAELADFVEHITVWAHAGINAEAFLDRFDLTAGERRRVAQLRRLVAAFWVMRLLPAGSAHDQNPPGTHERQAARLLDLLGSP